VGSPAGRGPSRQLAGPAIVHRDFKASNVPDREPPRVAVPGGDFGPRTPPRPGILDQPRDRAPSKGTRGIPPAAGGRRSAAARPRLGETVNPRRFLFHHSLHHARPPLCGGPFPAGDQIDRPSRAACRTRERAPCNRPRSSPPPDSRWPQSMTAATDAGRAHASTCRVPKTRSAGRGEFAGLIVGWSDPKYAGGGLVTRPGARSLRPRVCRPTRNLIAIPASSLFCSWLKQSLCPRFTHFVTLLLPHTSSVPWLRAPAKLVDDGARDLFEPRTRRSGCPPAGRVSVLRTRNTRRLLRTLYGTIVDDMTFPTNRPAEHGPRCSSDVMPRPSCRALGPSYEQKIASLSGQRTLRAPSESATTYRQSNEWPGAPK